MSWTEKPSPQTSQRLQRIQAKLIELARLEFGEPLRPSEKLDDVDSIMVGLNMLGEELQAAIAERDEARNKAEEASRAKSMFLATMSHEIRTPLHGMLGMIQLLKKSGLSEEQKEMVRLAKESASLLMKLVNQVLDLSRIEAASIQLEERDFSLRRCLDGVRSIVLPQCRDKGLQFELRCAPDLPDWIHADDTRLQQILLNLLVNALKFTMEGHIGLKAGLEKDGAMLGFCVEDSGIGIPEGLQSKVFDAFGQADTSIGRRFGGSGLGLAISRSLVELMGGRIRLQSEPGEGTRVTFQIRHSRPHDATPLEEQISAQTQAMGARVLVVEDDRVNRKLVVELLKRQGHLSREADSGPAAIEALRSQGFDLILMDCEMPGMSGLEATEAIRRGEAGGLVQDTPVVALTAHALPENRERCLQAGMNDFMAKPFGAKEFNALVARWLDGSSD